ncbi:MAG TPA: FKBP-type peptidyl-prolyl cis-trans isomerase, partial [Parapedobacter sp.]|nr:FKBP-type peptidyl-prolyl cis-trans isomerase [Parapedobacter sp.]
HDDFTDYEDAVIQQMITNASLNIDDFTKREDGIYYQIIEPGSGDVITTDSTITVDYTLKNPEGKVLDSGTDSEFSLASGIISAWSKIIPLINKGGKIRFFTPSDHAYGRTGDSRTAPFLSLDFEVEVKDE